MDSPPGGTYGGNSAEFPSVRPFVNFGGNFDGISVEILRKFPSVRPSVRNLAEFRSSGAIHDWGGYPYRRTIIWQYKFSGTAFLAETARNGVWDLVGDANLDLMVYKSSKLIDVRLST